MQLRTYFLFHSMFGFMTIPLFYVRFKANILFLNLDWVIICSLQKFLIITSSRNLDIHRNQRYNYYSSLDLKRKHSMELLKKIFKSLIIGLLAGTVVALFTHFFFSDIIDHLESFSYDMRYRWEYSHSSKEKIDSITDNDYGIYIVDIDDRSMQKMGFYYNWDRSYHANLINNLSTKFPAAIVFDIYFSNPEDQNHRKRLENLLIQRGETDHSPVLTDQMRQSIISTIDYDTKLEEAIKKAGCVYLGICLADESDYQPFALSQISSRMTLAWHDSLNPSSTITLSPEKLKTILNKKTIIDGTFPALARAAKAIGHVDFVPNEDGIIREVPLLFRFNDFNPAYLPVNMRTVASLFATPNDEIIYEPSLYIDIGKPFKIFKDTDSTLSASYPNVTMAQVKAICSRSVEIQSLGPDQKLEITSLLIAKRDSLGCISFEMNIAGFIPCEIVSALMNSDFKAIQNLGDQKSIALTKDVAIRKESGTDWVISAPFGAGEWYFSAEDIATLSLTTEGDLNLIKAGERKMIFSNFYVRNRGGQLTSSIPVLRQESLIDLCKFGWDRISSMTPGTRMDFGRNVQIPLTEDNQHIITFFGPKGKPFPTYSYYDIVNNRVQGQLEGKIFIVGSTAPALFDIKAAPIDKNYPGVEVHASLINAFLTNTFITRLTNEQNIIILLIVGLTIGFMSSLLKPLTASILTFLSVFVYFLVGMTIFNTNHLWIEIARPIITIFLSFAAVMVFRYITEEKDKKFLHNTFKQYLSPDLIDIMYKKRQQPILGGQEGQLTAYFTDIQGFSTFSEKLGSPTRIVELLNEYLSEMTDILLRHYGTLDKYEGDAIVAFFGAPMQMDDHAQQACLTALNMQKALENLRHKWILEGTKWPSVVKEMRMRIGINSGLITTGNMGSTIRKNYTMMGDAVNLAARLESAAKQYGVFTLISQNTYELVKNEFEFRKIDKITVFGKSDPVEIYELIAEKGGLTPDCKKMISLYNEGLDYFYMREWENAKTKFQEAHLLEPYSQVVPEGMTPSRKFIQYCEMYKITPPGTDWEGVTSLTSK